MPPPSSNQHIPAPLAPAPPSGGQEHGGDGRWRGGVRADEMLRYEVNDEVGIAVAMHGWIGGEPGASATNIGTSMVALVEGAGAADKMQKQWTKADTALAAPVDLPHKRSLDAKEAQKKDENWGMDLYYAIWIYDLIHQHCAK